jgi:hypothetical protein
VTSAVYDNEAVPINHVSTKYFFSPVSGHDIKFYFYILTQTRLFEIIVIKNEFKVNISHMLQDYSAGRSTPCEVFHHNKRY